MNSTSRCASSGPLTTNSIGEMKGINVMVNDLHRGRFVGSGSLLADRQSVIKMP